METYCIVWNGKRSKAVKLWKACEIADYFKDQGATLLYIRRLKDCKALKIYNTIDLMYGHII